jgi:hypothetical protein
MIILVDTTTNKEREREREREWITVTLHCTRGTLGVFEAMRQMSQTITTMTSLVYYSSERQKEARER